MIYKLENTFIILYFLCDVKAKIAPNEVKQLRKTSFKAIAIGKRGKPEQTPLK